MKAMIIWHYLDAKGVVINASSTIVEGEIEDLHVRIQESYTENAIRKSGGPTIPHQVLLIPEK